MEGLECGVIAPPMHRAWAELLIQMCGAGIGVELHLVPVPTTDHPTGLIAAHSTLLSRYDVCLVLVTPESLAWTRTELAAFEGDFPVPMVALTRRLRAAGTADLFDLGMADFVCDPVDPEELKTRVVRARSARRSSRGKTLSATETGFTGGQPQQRPLVDPRLLQEPAPLMYSGAVPSVDSEPFKLAKARVVEAFERKYIEILLTRYRGNISQAARAASKNRRAFWQLMRKHEIDASFYRPDPSLA